MQRIAIAALALMVAGCATAANAGYQGDARIGRRVAEDMCASCHAIGDAGPSPNAAAPPLRYVLAGYDPDRLTQDLQAAVSISHPKMPVFHFGEHHPDDLVAYLKTIQQPPPPR